MTDLQIIPYTPERRSAVLDLTASAWSPVFANTRHEVPDFVYDAFYPNGWQERQIEDVGALLDQNEVSAWVFRIAAASRRSNGRNSYHSYCTGSAEAGFGQALDAVCRSADQGCGYVDGHGRDCRRLRTCASTCCV